MKEIPDILYQVCLFLSYDDCMNISCLNKEFNLTFRKFRNSEIFLKFLKSKFLKRNSKEIILNLENTNNFRENQILNLNLKDSIYVYCNENAHNGDLIIYQDRFFILFDGKLYSMNYQGYSIPKYLQNKFGLFFFQNQSFKNISAFVKIVKDDFDFYFCKYFKLETIIYIRVWNKKLKIFIWFYIWNNGYQMKLDEIKDNAKLKISQILERHRMVKNHHNTFFAENGEIRIFLSLFEKIEKHEWFLE